MLIEDAVKAKLPLISIRVRDLINFKDVVAYVTGQTPAAYSASHATPPKETLLYHIADQKNQPDYAKLYGHLVKQSSTLLIVNSTGTVPESFDAGELTVPASMMRKALMETFDDEDFVNSLMPTVGGLTLKELGEIIRLTEVRDDGISPQGITKTRAILVPDLQGFSAVRTEMDGPYLPMKALADYADDNKVLFIDESITDQRLIPRGILLDGSPGTGKTQGTKWLANQWGVPLYRLDATILNKYYGESENNLKHVFAKVGQEAPCVLLIDEAEKLLGRNKNSEQDGMIQRMTQMILWQMQESRDRVFTVLTTNNKKLLPEELYREGRIDETITFIGLLPEEAKAFSKEILKSFFPKPEKSLVSAVETAIVNLFDEKDRVSHSSITQAVIAKVKRHIAKKQGG